jgi:hypothetical protein
MRAHHGAGALAIDVEVADEEFGGGAFRIFRLIVGVDRAGQPVLGVVGQFQRMIEVRALRHRQHRAEDLFLENARLRIDVGNHGRLDEIAVAFRRPAARDQPAFFLAGLDIVGGSTSVRPR